MAEKQKSHDELGKLVSTGLYCAYALADIVPLNWDYGR